MIKGNIFPVFFCLTCRNWLFRDVVSISNVNDCSSVKCMFISVFVTLGFLYCLCFLLSLLDFLYLLYFFMSF